jgi:hypothetical protein
MVRVRRTRVEAESCELISLEVEAGPACNDVVVSALVSDINHNKSNDF